MCLEKITAFISARNSQQCAVSRRNVLLYKPTSQSSSYYEVENNLWYNSSLAVDGDRDPNAFNGYCFIADNVEPLSDFLVAVDMIISYKVDYVLLWTRDSYADCSNNFIVGLTNVNYFNQPSNQAIRGRYPICGVYPYPIQTSASHWVNCSSSLPASRYVIAQQSLSALKGFCVCELEVFTTEEVSTNLMKRRSGLKLNGLVTSSLVFKYVQQCLMACQQLNGCLSVNFGVDSRLCDLNAGSVHDASSIEVNQSYDYWEIV
ncbi:hypothetical protein HELRODRAFT_177423 [Helobdella robusta]|uniref:Apple domain-containing protein n=1 Tax=Helobdella robusta TaxID=6412 RepID=T1FBN8_HELRO|nr:hypothetical protein HELRODRAFT_177423 [Helobdella robusta]ESN98177.1 hypothetical protein HELRODRAFT_177423 [Helobdella robusta]